MHDHLEERDISCPYCGEGLVIVIDVSAGDQQYIEDCRVCCRPIEIAVRLAADGSIAEIGIKREDE
jgi:transcription elongation factor Elf1